MKNIINTMQTGFFLGLKSIVRGNRTIFLLTCIMLMVVTINLLFLPLVLTDLLESQKKKDIDIVYSHLVLDPPKEQISIKDLDFTISKIRANNMVQSVNPMVDTLAQFRYQNNITNHSSRFINPDLFKETFKYQDNLVAGRLLEKNETGKILLPVQIAGNNDNTIDNFDISLKTAKVGSMVKAKFLNGVEKEFEVVGLFRTYNYMADYYAYFNVSDYENIYNSNWKQNVSRINIRLKDGQNLDTAYNEINKLNLGELLKYTSLPSVTTSLISSFSVVINLLRIVSIIVGAVTMFIVSYIDLVNKKKQIGIQRAIGITPSSILIQYIIRSSVYTILGLLLGYLVFIFAVIPLVRIYPLSFGFGPNYVYLDYNYISESFLAIFIIAIVSVVVPTINMLRLKIVDAIWG